MDQIINKQEWMKEQDKILNSIQARPHTVDEVAEYVASKYQVIPVEAGTEPYHELYLPFKCSLVQKEYPMLLKTPYPDPLKPEEMRDEEKRNAFLDQTKRRMAEAEAVPDSIVHLDFVVYRILVDGDQGGEILLQLERTRQLLSINYSIQPGYRQQANEIMLDIYDYYGVTQLDIDMKSERLLCYAMMLQQYSNKGSRP